MEIEDQKSVTLDLCGRARSLVGDYAGAGQYYEQALNRIDRLYGPWHSRYAATTLDLGILDRVRAPRESHVRIAHALAVAVAVRGPEHPDVMHCMRNLGRSYFLQREWPHARLWFDRAVSLGERIIGGSHPDVAIARGYLELSSADDLPDESREDFLHRVERAFEPVAHSRGSSCFFD